MNKIVFASSNEHKVSEVRKILGTSFEVLSLRDIGCTEDIPETQDTIEGNAKQKAEYVSKKYGLDCFADDTGLEIDALEGRPGIYSARYGGLERSAEKNMAKVLLELKGNLNRTARFKTVVAFSIKGEMQCFTGITKGTILESPKGSGGFGYDPIFQPEGYSDSFGILDEAIKNNISSRARAVEQFVNYLNALPVK